MKSTTRSITNSAGGSAPAELALPPEGTRTVVSLLIFVHLFAVLVGIFANEMPSEFETALGGLSGLREYRQILGMDLPYTYYFTRGSDAGGELDIDYRLSATITGNDGETETIELPAVGLWPGQRFHRYQKLASRLAEFAAEDADGQDVLGAAIAGSLLRAHDARTLDLRSRGTLTPPAMDQFQPGDATAVRTRDAYDKHAFLAGERVEMLKKEPARDTAPPPRAN